MPGRSVRLMRACRRCLGGLLYAAVGNRKPRILVAAMPKSGSTFFTNTLANLPNMLRKSLVPAYGRRAQELSESKLAGAAHLGFVAQQHVQNSEWTETLCRDYGVRVVVLTRDLLDILPSIRDHLHSESIDAPFFYPPADLLSRDPAAVEAFLMDFVLPWYVTFYMGWRASDLAVFVDYSEFRGGKPDAMHAIIQNIGLDVCEHDVKTAVTKALEQRSRINVGRPGRGSGLDPAIGARLVQLLDHYPEAAQDPYVVRQRKQALSLSAAGSDEAD